MQQRVEDYDFIVCGGGMAGFCAAMAAARSGLRTALVQDRPVLGGNASSEVRVTIHGAATHHAYTREGGIVGEFLCEERARNHGTINENGWINSVHDLTLYDLAMREDLLTLHLNTPVHDVRLADGSTGLGAAADRPQPHTGLGYYERPACGGDRRIAAVVGRVLNAEVQLELRAPLFCDATGDGLIAHLAGCAWRMGSEGRAETGEPHAPDVASTDTMGNSIHIRAIDSGREAPFQAPSWAMQYEDAAFFYEQGRKPSDPRGGFWWIEIGIPWHTIHDNETIRHELTRHALGVWDWMKNRDPRMRERCRTYALDFIGQVPGKRESRRIVGRHWLDENALQAREHFPDEIAFGGWFVDLHTPGGLLAPTSEPASAEGYRPDSEYAAKSYIGPYGIPLRSLMARDVDNCFLAGRCISTTRAALGTVRVMATTALMGEAVGTAAGIMREQELDLPALATDCETGGPVIRAVQQRLLRRGNWLPHVAHADPGDLARQARASASSSALLHGQSPADPILRGNLKWRPRGEHESCAQRQAQIVFLDGGALDSIELQLVGQGRLAVRLVRVTDIWDYRVGGSAVVAEGTLDVDGEQPCWYAWHCGLRDLPAGAYRIETGPGADAVSWSCVLGLQPGCVAQYHCSPTRLRARHNGQAFRLSPPQAVYGPEQVLSGVSRPQAASNCWRSDAGAGLPQWLQLDWDGRQRIGSVELCLAGHLLVEVHAEPPFYRDRQTLRDYCIQVPDAAGGWRDCLRVTDNYRRHRVHPLPEPVETDRLRLLCLATNGDPAACVYELRCYAGSGPS